MSIITETDAKTITGDYINNGDKKHFLFGGKTIKGYQFTRKELTDLFENNTNNEIFMMLALSGSDPNKYLNIVLAKMHDNEMNMNTMIVSSKAIYTDNVSYLAKGITVKSSDRKNKETNNKSIKSIHGQPIPVEELQRIQLAFETAETDDLSCTSTKRIKCYRLDRQDFNDLTLDQVVTETNRDDIFMFMPIIRPVRPFDPITMEKPYLSLAVARFDPATRKVSGAIIEYCLPCPSTCATNYWH